MSSSTLDPPSEVDTGVPSAARAYDYFLGGTDNFEVDREFAERALRIAPVMRAAARLNRSFQRRAVGFCLDQGIRQFLDIGSGLPTAGNVHQVAQRRVPGARVVYVDVDPVACAHGRRLLADNPFATILQADIREPGAILDHPETRRLIDFSEPVALLAVGVLMFVPDDDRPGDLIAAYRERLAPGSALAISHMASEYADPELREEMARFAQAYEAAGLRLRIRDHRDVLGFFGQGVRLVQPGLVFLSDWRPDDPAERDSFARPLGYAGIARIG
ncbi:SAM-dependent methyltransferase [Saccharothrix sp. HUAS TT1]|uniref:SAM-dependent methyltransferase n=1 Tax=unclassified Saccharothrix TaxID=2593673 RepID=UPI00345BC0C7